MYKAYYDRKTQESSLKVNDFVFLLNRKIARNRKKIVFNSFKVGTTKTQCMHRMRLCPFVPHNLLEHVDDDVNRHRSEPDAMDDQTILINTLPKIELSTPN